MKYTLRRFLVATALVGIGCAFLVDFVVTVREPGKMPLWWFRFIEMFVCLPIIGAGLFTPAKQPGLGAFFGFASFVAIVIYLLHLNGGPSYPGDIGFVLFLLFLLCLAAIPFRQRPPK